MAHIRYPIVGDRVYGGRPRLAKQNSEQLKALLRTFPRQALHASELSLKHPLSGEEMSFAAPLPDDILALLDALDNDCD